MTMETNLSSASPEQPFTLDIVKSLMDDIYYLTYVDYRNNLNGSLDTIAKCMKEKSSDSLSQMLDENYGNSQCEEVGRIIEELKQACIDEEYDTILVNRFFDENEDLIRDEIYNRDKSDYMGEIISNTRDIPVMV